MSISKLRVIDPLVISFENHIHKQIINDEKKEKPNQIVDFLNFYYQQESKIETKKERIILEEIGDTYLESIIDVDVPNFSITNEAEINKFRVKKDYVIMKFNCPKNEITEYHMYALGIGAVTYSIVLIRKRFLDTPIIEYSETQQDPTSLIDSVYFYQKQISRTIFMKRVAKTIDNDEKGIEIIDYLQNPRPDLNFNTTIKLEEVDQNILQLDIIIKNMDYISNTPNELLLKVVTCMMEF